MSEYWECECGWSHDEDELYYVEDGEMIQCTSYDSATRRLISTPSTKYKDVYPKFGPSNSNRWASMEFGGNPVDWDETHLCPHCNKEFTFSNSNY